MFRFTSVSLSVLLLPMVALATVPRQINHQGVVSVNGAPGETAGTGRHGGGIDDAPRIRQAI